MHVPGAPHHSDCLRRPRVCAGQHADLKALSRDLIHQQRPQSAKTQIYQQPAQESLSARLVPTGLHCEPQGR